MLILARPEPNGKPADEYYEIACGAHNNPKFEFPKIFLSGVNLNRIFMEISPDAKLEFSEGNGKISFELLIPWKDVKPSHPFLTGPIGFNLLLTIATSEPHGMIRYLVVDEDRIPFTKRNYDLLKFQAPKVQDTPQVNLNLKEGHIPTGGSLHFSLTALSPAPQTDSMKIEILKKNKPLGRSIIKKVKYAKGVTVEKLMIPTDLEPGCDYTVKWSSQRNPAFSDKNEPQI